MKTMLVFAILVAGSVQAGEPLWYSEYRGFTAREREHVLKIAIAMVHESVSLFGEEHSPQPGLPEKREMLACLQRLDPESLDGTLREHAGKPAPGETSLERNLFFAILDKCKVAEPYWPRRF